jgi:hypothetical protein
MKDVGDAGLSCGLAIFLARFRVLGVFFLLICHAILHGVPRPTPKFFMAR